MLPCQLKLRIILEYKNHAAGTFGYFSQQCNLVILGVKCHQSHLSPCAYLMTNTKQLLVINGGHQH